MFANKIGEENQWKKGPKVRLAASFKKLNERLGLKSWTALSVVFAIEVAECCYSFTGLVTFYGSITGLLLDFEEGGGNIVSEQIRHFRKKGERKKMIETGVGPGLAWYHYTNYLQYVLAVDIKDKLENSDFYKSLSPEKQQLMPKVLYELIPRKTFVEIHKTDDSIQLETTLRIDYKNQIEVHIYSIRDGNQIYYCMCDCPKVLKTMKNVNDIQMAGISRSKYNNFHLPWNRNSTVQLFTVDTKLVQLMRFYYTLSSLLCLNPKGKKNTRLLLFNESGKKTSEVLLQAIKEDLEIERLTKDGKLNTNSEGQEMGTLNYSAFSRAFPDFEKKSEAVTQDAKGRVVIDWSKMPFYAAGSEKTRRSLMEAHLVSTEEKKDIFYEYDVFVTHRRELTDKEKKTTKEYEKDVNKINEAFAHRNFDILRENDCRGKDWLTKLKYAATKCRWIVFLDTKETNSNLFASHLLTDSISRILESKKVQTVAIVNPRDDIQILDDLRWVTCIPYQNNITSVIETLEKVVSGFEINLKDLKDLYLKPGEVATGLAWNYAANHLNKCLPGITELLTKENAKKPYKSKLLIVVPKSCNTHSSLENADKDLTDEKTKSPPDKMPGKPEVYTMGPGPINEITYAREYPKPVDVIRQMRAAGVLNDQQMQSEVQIFYKTVDKIMEILLPDKTDKYEFVYYDDEENKLENAMMDFFQNDVLIHKHDELTLLLSLF